MSHEARLVVEALQDSPKYRHVCDQTLDRIAQRSLRQSRSLKEAVKRAKRKLHQVCAGFTSQRAIDRASARLEQVEPDADPAAQKRLGLELLREHASTRERIGLLDRFYRAIFAISGVPNRVLDLGCGLHPFALPWMELPGEAQYEAWDVDKRLVALLDRHFAGISSRAVARCRDVTISPCDEPADLAFLLKMVPTLEQQEKGGALRLLRQIPAPCVAVSFPTASLGGRQKGMRAHYAELMADLLAQTQWTAQRIDFDAELLFVVKKTP